MENAPSFLPSNEKNKEKKQIKDVAEDIRESKKKNKKRKREGEASTINKEKQIYVKSRIDKRENEYQEREPQSDPPLPTDWSIFTPDPETATTTVFLAPSFSGKTTLIVNELNKLTDEALASYAAIVLCTDSVAAEPLKLLEDRVLRKINILDSFVPEYIAFMKKTNTLTNNRFRYLVIMDDCLDLRGPVLVKMILTLRNSGISTAISIQYSKLLSPAQRQSIHDYYLMNLRLEDLEYLLTGFIATHMRDRLNEEGDPKAFEYSVKQLASAVRKRLEGRKMIHYDQRHDKINIYS